MSFNPVQPPPHPLSPALRNWITRLTLLVVTIALVYGCYRCISVALSLIEDARKYAPQPTVTPMTPKRGSGGTGAELPLLIGAVLGLLALVTGLGAIMPWRFFDRFVRAPDNPKGRIAAPRDYFKV